MPPTRPSSARATTAGRSSSISPSARSCSSPTARSIASSHRFIEEFMILANVAAAETLERARVPLIYRVHDEPALEKIHALREFLRTLDISLQKSQALRPADFNRILARVEGSDVAKLVHEVGLRSQSQAEFDSGENGRFSKIIPRSAHDHSLLRRYAYMIVHRAPEGLG